jgi:hypothetical protein
MHVIYQQINAHKKKKEEINQRGFLLASHHNSLPLAATVMARR